MKIGIDFDRVLFDTDGFKEDLNREFPDFSETYDQAKKDGFYNLEKHAEIMDVPEEELLEEMRECEEYLYSDVEKLERLREDNELIIVTRGDPVIQKEKLEYSGALKYFDGYEIITEGSKDVADIDFLVDDWGKELDRIDLPGLIIDREKDGADRIIDHLDTPDFEAVFRRYDIRGKYPEELNEQFAYRLGKSIAALLKEKDVEGKITVCKDPKKSSDNLKKSLIRGVISQGIEVLNCGTGPTDYLAFSAVENESIGVQVTSSHMPLNFNGFKLVYPEGNGFMNRDLDRLKKIFRENSFETGATGKETEKKYHGKYLDRAEDFIRNFFSKIERKTVIENLGGKESSQLEELMERIGAEVVNLSSEKPERNPPDPKPENLSHIGRKVDESNAELGIATDMDADRVAVYFQGEWLSGDEIFATLIEVMRPEKVVASIDSTEIVEKTAEKYGEIDYTRVGDPFVIERTLELEAELSGEPNGHYCFTDFVPYNSGTLAAAMIACADLEEIRKKLPEIHVSKNSLEVEDKHEALEKVKKRIKEKYEVISEIDGVKFKIGKARVLIRSSGSSHKLRITAESESQKEAENALEKSEELIRNT